MIVPVLISCCLAWKIATSFVNLPLFWNAKYDMFRYFARRRSSKELKNKPVNDLTLKRENAAEDSRNSAQSLKESDKIAKGWDRDVATAPPVGEKLQEEIETQRKLLQSEFDLERMHRELLHLEVEKLDMARENQLMNRQFMAVLNERRELDLERKEMITTAVQVWKEVSEEERTFTNKKVSSLNDVVPEVLHKPVSIHKIKQQEPRLLKRLRRCQTEAEVRSFQLDVKKRQEVLFQLLLKSETMVVTGTYHNKNRTRRENETNDTTKVSSNAPGNLRRRQDPSKTSNRPVAEPPQPPSQDMSINLRQVDTANVGLQQYGEAMEEEYQSLPIQERSHNLSWNTGVREIKETAI